MRQPSGPTRDFLHILFTAAVIVLAQPPLPADAQPAVSNRIEVRAQPIATFDTREKDRQRFGMLDFRGGLELTSPARDFGGISSIRLSPDGSRFIAVTDKARWIRGRVTYNGSKPNGLADVELAPMLDANGKRLAARGWYDTESIAEDGSTIYVGIERVHRIVKFDFGKDALRARAVPIPLPSGITTLPSNHSIEALVMVPSGLPLAGTLIAISERGLDAAGNIRGFLIGGPRPGEFAVKRTEEFDVSDAVLLRGGDMLLLERRASWLRGIAARIRRIALSDLRPDALVDGAVIFYADLGQQIDNMEGIAVHRAPTGETELTLVSDDNFSVLQRTLLLQFTLVGE